MKETSLLPFVIAFATGGLLSMMVLFNGTLANYGSLLFAAWLPHLTGTFAAIIILLILRPAKNSNTRAPFWAYLGGVSGGVTVMLTSATINTALALSGTIAIGLAGQLMFSLIADARGSFGLKRRTPTRRDYFALVLIFAGSVVLIFWGSV